MKPYKIICLSLFFVSCASIQITDTESKKLLTVYVNARINEESKEVLYISENLIENVFIVDALEIAQWQSSRDSITRKSKYKIKSETAKHFMNQNVMNYYYSQLTYNDSIGQNEFMSDKVVLINWNRDIIENEELTRKASVYLKSVSKPLISKDNLYALILEMSDRNGCIIFIYKKIDGKWVEFDSITTCLI